MATKIVLRSVFDDKVPASGGEYNLSIYAVPTSTKLEIVSAPGFAEGVYLEDCSVTSQIKCPGYHKLQFSVPKNDSALGRKGSFVIQEVCKSGRCRCASLEIPFIQSGDISNAPEPDLTDVPEEFGGECGGLSLSDRVANLEDRVSALETQNAVYGK